MLVHVRPEFNLGCCFLAAVHMVYSFIEFFKCAGALPTCVSVHHVCAVPAEARRNQGKFPATGVTYSCELPCGFWETNPGPLQEQQMFLIPEPLSSPPFPTILLLPNNFQSSQYILCPFIGK